MVYYDVFQALVTQQKIPGYWNKESCAVLMVCDWTESLPARGLSEVFQSLH